MKELNEQSLIEMVEEIKEIQSNSKEKISITPDSVFYIPDEDGGYTKYHLGEKH